MNKLPPQKQLALLLSAVLLPCVATQVRAQETTSTVTEHAEVKVVTIGGDGKAHTFVSESGPRVIITESGDGKSANKVIETANSFAFTSGDVTNVDVFVSNALSSAFSGATLSAKAIKNAPYSAEVINETVQLLPDGNTITKRTSSFSARDSAGRTRTETRDASGAAKSISINDPVDGHRLFLSPASKTATKLSFDKELGKRIEEIREKARSMAKSAADGKAVVVEGNPGNEIRVMSTRTPDTGKLRELREEVSVKVLRDAEGKVRTDRVNVIGPEIHLNSSLGSLGGLARGQLGASFSDAKYLRTATSKDLGTRDIDGIRAEGKMRSYTIPAGDIGNKAPITVTTETWTSPDLGITVYSKHSDPRSGETIYRLANLKRGEQPLSLFTAPDGYTMKESPAISVGQSAK